MTVRECPSFISRWPTRSGLLAEGLKEALRRRTFRPKICGDFMGGLKRGVNGTPTFFINGTRHDAGGGGEGGEEQELVLERIS